MIPPSRTSARFRAVLATPALACALLVAATALPPSAVAGEVEDDPAVVEARQRLAEQRADAAAIARSLDAAAGAYERANDHQVRLAEEAEGHSAAVAGADSQVDQAREDFARSVAATYRHAGADLAVAGAVARAPDAATALHRAALVERVAAAERARALDLQAVAALVADDTRQHEVVRAGVATAVADARAQADALAAALEQANRSADQAAGAVTTAEQQARERIEEERRRAEAAARAEALARAGTGAPPPVDGKVCPIGAPNGFINSWGFARSGGRKHQGIDMFASYGMPLYAVADGTITKVGHNRLGGLSLHLVDEAGDRYYYAHLSHVAVSSGQRVSAGEVVGANGNSGNARTTPPHLHWQYHPGGGAPVNPFPLAQALCR